MKQSDTTLFSLFKTFAFIGSITFGGGYAMLPFLEKEVVEKNQWATQEQILDYYSLGQCTPGIIAVNVATFIGYEKRGIPGAIAATLGMIFPSLIIITTIAAILTNFKDNIYIQRSLAGIKVAVCALVLQSIIKLSKKSIIDFPTLFFYIIFLTLLFIFHLSTIYVVISGILIGLLFNFVIGKIKNEEKK